MTYAFLTLPFLAGAAIGGILLTRRLPDRRGHATAVVLTVVVLIALTAVFDSIMIGAGLFGYEESLILGVRIGLAPLEDFAYPVAVAVALPALWATLTMRGRTPMGRLLRGAFVASRPVSWVNTAFPFGPRCSWPPARWTGCSSSACSTTSSRTTSRCTGSTTSSTTPPTSRTRARAESRGRCSLPRCTSRSSSSSLRRTSPSSSCSSARAAPPHGERSP
ncbi:lycopene cyclase domain-containing protein [Microbacterium sp. NIBRBAC000506063]|nr:lycopene cyclase domain-containing protein [Microbacterium sp. NIBRBAC000506063]